MKTVNKKEFPLVDKLINSLLEKFKKQRWQFPKNLPEIYLSDEIIQLPINKNGLQGFYPNIKMISPNKNEAALLSVYKYETETPIIIIYEKVLEETAKKFEIDRGISFEEARINLFYCAILNEISKWILVDTPKKDTWIDNPLNKKDHLHECLTALLSYWICKDGSLELKKTFKYLMFLHTKGQINIGEYNRYSDYTSPSFEIPSVINCINICREESYEYFELLGLLLDISIFDKTLDRNNFNDIIVKHKVQEIVKNKHKELNHKDSNYRKLTNIIYDDFLSKENQSEYNLHYKISPDYGI
jgi:hypothetical protein